MEENNVMNETAKEAEQLPKNMKLCKTCGAQMAKNAKRCPSCGAKNKKPIYKRIWFWILAIIVVVLIVKAVKRSGLDVKNPSAKLTADELLREYYEGEEKGSEKYDDKVVAVTGIVFSVDDGYITIQGFAHDFTLVTVHVKFADKGDISKVTKGSVITVSGICNGRELGGVELEKAIIDSSFAVNPDYASAMSVPIQTLMQEYKDNNVSADAKYWGKTVEISGRVDYIGSDYIVLKPENMEDSLDTALDGITVYFESSADMDKVKTDANPNALGSPESKTIIKVAGVCYGETIGYDAHIARAKLK